MLTEKESWLQCLIEIIEQVDDDTDDLKCMQKKAHDIRIDLIELYAGYEVG